MAYNTTKNKYKMSQITSMVEQKCINHECEHFSHCGCLDCDVFKNHPKNCEKFVPCKIIPRW